MNGVTTASFKIPQVSSVLSSLVAVSFDINGNIETATKVLPISSNAKGSISVIPEGGFIGCSVKNRVYFQALDSFNKSVNVEGRIVDSTNQKVAELTVGIDGRGRSEYFTANPKSVYFLEVTSPLQFAGQKTVLPMLENELIVMHRCRPYPVMSAKLVDNMIHVEIRSARKVQVWVELHRLHHLITTKSLTKQNADITLDPSGFYGVVFSCVLNCRCCE